MPTTPCANRISSAVDGRRVTRACPGYAMSGADICHHCAMPRVPCSACGAPVAVSTGAIGSLDRSKVRCVACLGKPR